MTAWRKEEANAARLHQMGKTNEAKNVFVQESIEPPKRHRLAHSRRSEGINPVRGMRWIETCVAPKHVDASRGAPLALPSMLSTSID